MMPANFDWRSSTEDDYLKHLDRPGFAWEFLRRNPAYQEDYETIVRGAASDVAQGKTETARVRVPRHGPHDPAGQLHRARAALERARLNRRVPAARERGVEKEDREHRRDGERDYEPRRTRLACHGRSLALPPS